MDPLHQAIDQQLSSSLEPQRNSCTNNWQQVIIESQSYVTAIRHQTDHQTIGPSTADSTTAPPTTGSVVFHQAEAAKHCVGNPFCIDILLQEPLLSTTQGDHW
jgi:hypothetical protein